MKNISEMFHEFLEFQPRISEIEASKVPSKVFEELGKNNALEAFHMAAKMVPAYKDFLQKNHINPEKIKTYEDFQTVPLTDKKNYLTKYELKDMLIAGSFHGKSAITSSSGSSGVPLFWPRLPIQDFGASKGWDSYLVNTFNIDKRSTLHLNCSGLGIWTAGDYVTMLNKYLCYKYPNNSSMAPGIDIENTVRVIESVSSEFEQTIIYSYPPFAKDIIDNLPPRRLKKCGLKLVVYGEPYTEKWRDYILRKIGGVKDLPTAVSSVLGSSEGGLIGSETVACTTVRILAHKKNRFCVSLFGRDRVPSLIQFNPMSKFIEIIGNNIVFTDKSGLPLIRYDTHDVGNLLTKEEISSVLAENINVDFIEATKSNNGVVTAMPYLYVYGRSDYSASIYGVLIFPEIIKDIIATNPFAKYLSGRFVMSTIEDKDSNQNLSIVCECKKQIDVIDVAIPTIEKLFAEHLKIYSSEYSKLLSSMGSRVYPKVELRNYNDDEYFSSKNKQKYLM